MDKLEEFIREHKIAEVECLVPDMSGIARGKIIPADKLLRILRERGMPLPETVFVQTVTGDYPDDIDNHVSETYGDVYITPDEATVRLVPWYQEATAQVICDPFYADDTPVPVLAPGEGKTKTGRLWTYVRDDRPAVDASAPAVWLDYSLVGGYWRLRAKLRLEGQKSP